MSAITNNRDASRYEQQLEGSTLFADYQQKGDVLYITLVEAPPALRGSGAAGRFMEGLMVTLRAEKIQKVVPVCSYAATWLTRHPEYADLVKR